jgi:hypothetical protein
MKNTQTAEKSFGIPYCSEDEERNNLSALEIFCLVVMGILITIILVITVASYFFIRYLEWGNGLHFLIPLFFLFVCYQICLHYHDIGIWENEKDDLED